MGEKGEIAAASNIASLPKRNIAWNRGKKKKGKFFPLLCFIYFIYGKNSTKEKRSLGENRSFIQSDNDFQITGIKVSHFQSSFISRPFYILGERFSVVGIFIFTSVDMCTRMCVYMRKRITSILLNILLF